MVDTGDYKEVKGRKSAHKARRDQELYELQGLLKSYAARFFSGVYYLSVVYIKHCLSLQKICLEMQVERI